MNDMDIENKEQIEEYAIKIMRLARDTITVRFRFFDNALNKIKIVPEWSVKGYLSDGERLLINPKKLLVDYSEETNFPVRLYLHVMFHYIFMHPYRYDKAEEEYWNLACDIACENVILDMELECATLTSDDEKRTVIMRLRKWINEITAEKIYREFMVGGLSMDSKIRYEKLFSIDTHRKRVTYKEEPETIITKEDWDKISERVKAELKSFSSAGKGNDSISVNIKEAKRKRYDFEAILSRFAVTGETIKVNPEEFDLVYYTYGLKLYDNLPLIEPLEYTEDKRVKEFVIAIDTSASCRGETVENFLNKTFDILKNSGSFFKNVNIHIIQCDARIQSDTVVKNHDELKNLLKDFKLKGFGATDYRPVFEYVDDLIEKKELENLKGIVYFTDGYGIYPEKAPLYDVIFAFIGIDDFRPKLPDWAIKAVLEDENEY